MPVATEARFGMQLLACIVTQPIDCHRRVGHQAVQHAVEGELTPSGEPLISLLHTALSAALEENGGGLNRSILLTSDAWEVRQASSQVLAMPVRGAGCLTAGSDNTLELLLWSEDALACRVVVMESHSIMLNTALICKSGMNEVRLPLTPLKPGSLQLTVVEPTTGSVLTSMLLLALPHRQRLDMEGLCRELLDDQLRCTLGSEALSGIFPLNPPEHADKAAGIADVGSFSVVVDAWHKVTQSVFTDYGFLLGSQHLLKDRRPKYIKVLEHAKKTSYMLERPSLPLCPPVHADFAEEVLEDMLVFLVKRGRMACVELLLTWLFCSTEESGHGQWQPVNVEFLDAGSHMAQSVIMLSSAVVTEKDSSLDNQGKVVTQDKSSPSPASPVPHHETPSDSSSCVAEIDSKGDLKGSAAAAICSEGGVLSGMNFFSVIRQLWRWSLKGFASPAVETQYYLHLCHKNILLDQTCTLMYLLISLSLSFQVLVSSNLLVRLASSWTPCSDLTYKEQHILMSLLLILLAYNLPYFLLWTWPKFWLSRRESVLLAGLVGTLAIMNLGLAVGILDIGPEAAAMFTRGGVTYWVVYVLRAFSMQARFPRYMAWCTLEIASLALTSWIFGLSLPLTLLKYGRCWMLCGSLGLAIDMVSRLAYVTHINGQARSKGHLHHQQKGMAPTCS